MSVLIFWGPEGKKKRFNTSNVTFILCLDEYKTHNEKLKMTLLVHNEKKNKTISLYSSHSYRHKQFTSLIQSMLIPHSCTQ